MWSAGKTAIKPEIVAAEIEQVRALAVDAGRKLGTIDPARVAATVRVIAGAYTLNKPASPEEMWAAGFVPRGTLPSTQ